MPLYLTRQCDAAEPYLKAVLLAGGGDAPPGAASLLLLAAAAGLVAAAAVRLGLGCTVALHRVVHPCCPDSLTESPLFLKRQCGQPLLCVCTYRAPDYIP